MINSMEAERREICAPTPSYCYSIQGLLKWLSIIFTIIVYCLILSPHNDNAPLLLKGEEFTIITCTISLFFALLFLISIGFGCNRGKLCWDCPCGKLAYVIYFLLMVMWFVAGGVETYATVHYGDWSNNERFNRRAAAAIENNTSNEYIYVKGVT
uniref:Uncharacterized protein n=1 Tax=Romanomermis culicivorax TaxID=13658 RepID=A0A915JTI7_ROMCU